MIMNLNFWLLIILFLSRNIYGLDSDDYDYPVNSSDVSEDNIYSTSDGDHCSEDKIIDRFVDIFIPDDYEEGKANIKTSMGTLNETLEAMNRLQVFGQNISRKMSEFNKRITNRMSEALMTINLEPNCMTSLMRIMSAARNGEVWALKCKLYLDNNIITQ